MTKEEMREETRIIESLAVEAPNTTNEPIEEDDWGEEMELFDMAMDWLDIYVATLDEFGEEYAKEVVRDAVREFICLMK